MGKYCSKCGSPLSPIPIRGQYYKSPSNSSSIIAWIVGFVVVAIVIGIATDSGGNSDEYAGNVNVPKTAELIQETKSLFRGHQTSKSIQSIKDIGEMNKAIDNTVWTHTKTGDLWYKLVFKKDKVYIYSAFPSDGKWTFDEECEYTLEEGRYIDDGRRYIAAVIKSEDIDLPARFSITNGHLYMLGIDIGGFVLGDYEWD